MARITHSFSGSHIVKKIYKKTDVKKIWFHIFLHHFFAPCLKNVYTKSFKNTSKNPGRPLRDTYCKKKLSKTLSEVLKKQG